ncbi:MAG: hypothetical protein KKF44_01360 [Nanoarchaeota archaeon]|nr:hypothetical protein [Nanoarchaeota archaeon]
MKERENMYIILVLCIMTIAAAGVVMAVEPSGADITQGASSRRNLTLDPSQINAQAGNVTALNINQSKVTDIWQGYYGNISGSITLDNANNKTFYDWSYASTSGEVYASRSSISSWDMVNCSNDAFKEAEDSTLGITSTWVDSVNSTFTSTGPSFGVASATVNNCPGAQAYNNLGVATYWNVLLNVSETPVYVSVINDDADAFDGAGTADFELMVPTTYSSGTATYYFYAELN